MYPNSSLTYEKDIKWIGKISMAHILCSIFSLILILFYAYTKNYMLSNIIAIFLVMTFFKTVRLPSYKIGLAFLGLAFFYDIFWVFYSDKIFGKSVMKEVATKVDLPLKL
jgi:hypothetical protein